jgi:glycerophosphoryl diester phosphodiesterase
MNKGEVNIENNDGGNSEWADAMADVEEMVLPNVEVSDTEKKEDEGQDVEKLLDRAKLYREFGRIAVALTNLDEAILAPKNETIMDAGEGEFPTPEAIKAPEDVQADALIKQLESALSDVDRSLENQLDYEIVNHKQINTRDALEHELQSGSGIPELDIRFDKDGKAWISHSPRAGARFFFSKPIHKLHSEEVEQYGERLSLEDGLDIFLKYFEDNPNHKVVLEIKELGASKEAAEELLENIRVMLEERGLTDTAIFATLSPAILKAVHDKFPENSKILNGGIAPVISYDLAEKSLGPDEDKEFAFKLPNVELFFSNSSEVKERADGYGKQTGYLWTRLPRETVKTLRQMNENGGVGAASLTVVNKFANILDKFSPKTAKKLREHYAAQLDQLGIRKQVAISKSNPAESLMRTKAQMGQDSIIYSDVSPGDFAAELPKIDKE